MEVYERLDILSVVWEGFVRVMLFVCCLLVWKTFVAVILFTGLDTMVIRLNEDWNKKAERKIKPYIRFPSTNTPQTYNGGAWIEGRLSLARSSPRGPAPVTPLIALSLTEWPRQIARPNSE